MTYHTHEFGIFVDGECVERGIFDQLEANHRMMEIPGSGLRPLLTWRHEPSGNVQVTGTIYSTEGVYVDERSIPAEFRPWRPFENVTAYGPDGTAQKLDENETFWSNSHYLVFKRVVEAVDPEKPPMIHLSMRTVENDTRHDWREMQRVKNEICGEDWEAVEIYPAEDRVVDSANQFHLWCFPFRLPFGFASGMKHTAQEAAEVGATQREREAS